MSYFIQVIRWFIYTSILLSSLHNISAKSQPSLPYSFPVAIFSPGGKRGLLIQKGSSLLFPFTNPKGRRRHWMGIYRILPNAMMWLIEQILKEQFFLRGPQGLCLLSAKSIQWIFNRAWQLQLLQFNLKDTTVSKSRLCLNIYIYIFIYHRHVEFELNIRDLLWTESLYRLTFEFWMIACHTLFPMTATFRNSGCGFIL